MPALRVHVRPPHRHKGLMILCAFYGTICGVFYFLANEYVLVPLCERITPSLPSIFAFYVEPAVVFTTLLLPPVLCALYFARACQHYKYAYFGGQIMGCCYAAAMFTTACLHEGSPLLGMPWWGYLVMIGVDLGAGAIVGLLNLLFAAVHYNWGSSLLAQDGTLCNVCGYCVVYSSADRCPECGFPRDTPLKSNGRILHFAQLLGTHSRKLKYSAVVVLVLAVAGFAHQQVPIWRLKQRFKSECHVQPVTSYTSATGQYGGEAYGASTCMLLDDDPANRVIMAYYYRRTFFGDYRMLLNIAYHVSMPDGRGGTWTYNQMGNPRVACDLDEQQAAFVVSSGIPESLSDAMIQAADNAAWAPLQQGVQPQWKDGVVVSADGHFPE